MEDTELEQRAAAQQDSKIKSETFNRAVAASVSNIDEARRTVELTFASEYEVERWYGIEKLEMTPRAADLNRLNNKGALLSDHNRNQQIGVVERAWVGDDKRAHAIVRFSRSASGEQEFNDVVDGIRTNVSFGYRVTDYKTEKGMSGAPDKITATRWEAMEISLVSIPADPTIGVGRSAAETDDLIERKDAESRTVTDLDDERRAETPPAQVEEKTKEIRGSKTQMKTEVTEDTPNPGTAQFTREDEILGYGKKFGVDDLARSFAADPNKSFADFQNAVRAKFAVTENVPATPATPSELGLTEKEVKRYSISRAIVAQADGKWKGAEFERECSEAIAEKLGRSTGGFFVPSEVQNHAPGQSAVDSLRSILGLNTRDLSVAGGLTTGGALVGTDHLAGSFIDILRSKMVMLSLGVRVMSGLVGDISIPRQDGTMTGYWVAEGVAPAESQPSFGQLPMTPKTCGAVTEFTRKLLLQSSPSIEMLVWADIAAVMARMVDSAIINGTGTNGQPRGILNTTGVEEVNLLGAAYGFADAVNVESLIAEANAPQSTAFVMRPGIAGTLKTRPKVGNTYPVFLIGDDGRLNGYRTETTTQMPTNTILFGDFSQVILGEWGVLEIESNRLGSGFRAGNIEVRGLHSVDVAVRYPQAFKKLTAFV